MKTKIDSMGRVGIPKKIRTLLHWEDNIPLEIFADPSTGALVLKKSEAHCVCCGSKTDLVLLKCDIYLCSSCAKRATEQESYSNS